MSEVVTTTLKIVVPPKRVSRVFVLGDMPRGTRRRNWGFLHDQVWFYDVPKSRLEYHDDTNDEVPIYTDGRHFWRCEYGGEARDIRWLRLYMDRRILWLGPVTIRLHRFFSGDDDQAVHDHQWNFVTVPFSSYEETVEEPKMLWDDDWRLRRTTVGEWRRAIKKVRAWVPHYRPAEYRHIVHEPPRPFSTFVIAWAARPWRKWGFWPEPNRFIPNDEWTRYE